MGLADSRCPTDQATHERETAAASIPRLLAVLMTEHFAELDRASSLMETVWSNDDDVVTSRHRVADGQVVPISRKVFGLAQAFLGALIAAALAPASWPLRAWRRRARAAKSA